MAEALNITQGAISHIETDTKNTRSLRALIPYAQALGFKITFNLEKENSESSNEMQNDCKQAQTATEQENQSEGDTASENNL